MPYSEQANLRIFSPAPYSDVCPVVYNIQKTDSERVDAVVHYTAFIYVQEL